MSDIEAQIVEDVKVEEVKGEVHDITPIPYCNIVSILILDVLFFSIFRLINLTINFMYPRWPHQAYNFQTLLIIYIPLFHIAVATASLVVAIVQWKQIPMAIRILGLLPTGIVAGFAIYFTEHIVFDQ